MKRLKTANYPIAIVFSLEKKTHSVIRASLVLILSALVLSGCTKLFFYPYKTLVGTPANLGFNYSDVWLTTEDATSLHAWLIPPEEKPRGLVLFLHGNAENISTHIRSALWLVVQGYTVLALDYRGFGMSQGTPNLPQVFDDINTAFKWLLKYKTEHVPEAPLYVFGQSLGASLSIKYLDLYPGARSEVSGLIAEAAFTRYGSIAKHVAAGSWVTWAFQFPVQWIMPRRYDPLDSMARLEPLPILLVHSKQDEIIPFAHAQQLFEKAGVGVEFLEADGPHIHGIRSPATRLSMLGFLSRHTQ